MEYEDISRLFGSKTSTREKSRDCRTHNEQAFIGDPLTNPGGKSKRFLQRNRGRMNLKHKDIVMNSKNVQVFLGYLFCF